MAAPRIEEAFDVFVHDGDAAIGAVRVVSKDNGGTLLVDVENGGAFRVPFAAVRDVVEGKVILDCGKLDPAMKRAIGHAHDAEDPLAPDRPLPGEND